MGAQFRESAQTPTHSVPWGGQPLTRPLLKTSHVTTCIKSGATLEENAVSARPSLIYLTRRVLGILVPPDPHRHTQVAPMNITQNQSGTFLGNPCIPSTPFREPAALGPGCSLPLPPQNAHTTLWARPFEPPASCSIGQWNSPFLKITGVVRAIAAG